MRGEVALLLPRQAAIMAHTNTNSRVFNIPARDSIDALSQEPENASINAQHVGVHQPMAGPSNIFPEQAPFTPSVFHCTSEEFDIDGFTI